MSDKKIKIALIIDSIDYLMGGTERQLLLLYEHFDRLKFQPYLIVLSDSPWCKANMSRYDLKIFPSNRLRASSSWYNMFRLIKFFRREAIDAAIVYMRDATFYGVPCAVIARIPIIISARRGVPYWKNWFELMYMKLLNRFVSGFLLNTIQLARDLTGIEKVNSSKMQVVYNGFNLPVIDLPAEEIALRKRGWGFSGDVPLALIIANLRPVKRVDMFIDAAAKVIATGTNMGFLIIGSGELEEELVRQVKGYGLENKVIFLGRRNDVSDILPAVDIGVLCSDSEALPNAVIEYMAFGLPVVCTAVGGCLELVTENINGFLVEPGDSGKMAEHLVCLSTDAGLCERLGRESKKKVSEQFTVNSVVRSTEDYIRGFFH